MIVTVTPNPSIDRTAALPGPLTRGGVHRISSVISEPGGKGVNVARALTLAGLDTVAVLPAADNDPILAGLRAQRVRFHAVPVRCAVRTNLAITEPDGTTTKVNEPGTGLDLAESEALARAVVELGREAQWVVLSGSLPPGLPATVRRMQRTDTTGRRTTKLLIEGVPLPQSSRRLKGDAETSG